MTIVRGVLLAGALLALVEGAVWEAVGTVVFVAALFMFDRVFGRPRMVPPWW
jgi:hypothetical protein